MILPLFLHKTGPQNGNSVDYPPHHIHHWKALELTEILAPTLRGYEVENQAPDFFQRVRTDVGLFRWTASYKRC